MKIIIILLLINSLFAENIILDINDIENVLSKKEIKKNEPLIFIFDNGVHGKKIKSIIIDIKNRNKLKISDSNIILIYRNFKYNELSDYNVIRHLSNKFKNQKIYINMSYGYKLKIHNKFVSYKKNNLLNDELLRSLNSIKLSTNNFINVLNDTNNVLIFKSFGNYIYFHDELLNVNYNTNKVLSGIYQEITKGDFYLKVKLSKYMYIYLSKNKNINTFDILHYINNNINSKFKNINLIKNLVRYSIVEIYSQSINNKLLNIPKIKLVESINFNTIYNNFKLSNKNYNQEIKNNLDLLNVKNQIFLISKKGNFNLLSEIENFKNKYIIKYPELFISTYQHYSTLFIDKDNLLNVEGSIYKIKYSNLNEIIKDSHNISFNGTSSSTPVALVNYIIKEKGLKK